MRIMILGSKGFLGTHLARVLARTTHEVIHVDRSFGNLENFDDAYNLLSEMKPRVVVHLAAYSGGIGANDLFPADFYFRNTVLTANIFEAASRIGSIRKIIYPIGGCSYPANVSSPISEDQLWQGFPHVTSAAYSTSKMMGTVAAMAYEKQYGLSTQLLIPGNMYGEFDNFSLRDSHVIPALIRKFSNAVKENAKTISVWGSGKAQRDFVYAGDVASIIAKLIPLERSVPIMNISSGEAVTIRELVGHVAEVTGFAGEVHWDETKGDGQLVKIFDTSRMRSAGFSCGTSLRDGLLQTYQWFCDNISIARLADS